MFPAKLLLFGEHLLLHGAPALSVPVPAFGGDWAWRTPEASPGLFSDRLLAFAESAELRSEGLDASAFADDLRRGLYFDSTIPVGYGLGSSGALCAAVYSRYFRGAVPDDLGALRSTLAALERFFHGRSSGIDPLTSYLGQPLLTTGPRSVERFDGAQWGRDRPVVFLLDTAEPRASQQLIEWFTRQSSTDSFSRLLHDELIPAHLDVLEAWQAADAPLFWPALERFSALQWLHLKPMVASLDDVWRASLGQSDYCLKLCGAGGGGFALGFARDRAALEPLSRHFQLYFPFETDEVEG